MRDFWASLAGNLGRRGRGEVHQGPCYHSYTADVEELEVEELSEAGIEFYAHVEIIDNRAYVRQFKYPDFVVN